MFVKMVNKNCGGLRIKYGFSAKSLLIYIASGKVKVSSRNLILTYPIYFRWMFNSLLTCNVYGQ